MGAAVQADLLWGALWKGTVCVAFDAGHLVAVGRNCIRRMCSPVLQSMTASQDKQGGNISTGAGLHTHNNALVLTLDPALLAGVAARKLILSIDAPQMGRRANVRLCFAAFIVLRPVQQGPSKLASCCLCSPRQSWRRSLNPTEHFS